MTHHIGLCLLELESSELGGDQRQFSLAFTHRFLQSVLVLEVLIDGVLDELDELRLGHLLPLDDTVIAEERLLSSQLLLEGIGHRSEFAVGAREGLLRSIEMIVRGELRTVRIDETLNLAPKVLGVKGVVQRSFLRCLRIQLERCETENNSDHSAESPSRKGAVVVMVALTISIANHPSLERFAVDEAVLPVRGPPFGVVFTEGELQFPLVIVLTDEIDPHLGCARHCLRSNSAIFAFGGIAKQPFHLFYMIDHRF